MKEEYSKDQEIHIQTTPGDYKTIIKNISSYDEYYMKGHKLVIKTPKAEKVLHEILHIIENTGEKLEYVDVHGPTLEEIFQAVTKDVVAKRGFLNRK